MNILHNEDLLQRLASEYVLGTLRGGARRRFEYWMQQDRRVQQAVEQWQEDLQPLTLLVTPQRPPERVWFRIEEKRLLLTANPTANATANSSRISWLTGLKSSLGFWRGFSLVATAAALVLAVRLLATGVATPVTTQYVASLADAQKQQVALVTSDPTGQHIVLTLLAPPPEAGHVYELWAVPVKGTPLSLGLINTVAETDTPAENKGISTGQSTGSVRASLPPGLDMIKAPVLAVTLEPAGGARPGTPSGPVVFSGKWVQV